MGYEVMGNEHRFEHIVKRRQETEAPARQRRHEEESHRQLSENAIRKLKTSFIGALSKFEHRFGYLWGHGRPLCDLNEDEREWRHQWEACRNDVLNNGNSQIRAFEQELAKFVVSWQPNHFDATPCNINNPSKRN